MKYLTIIALILCSIVVKAQQKMPDTSHTPKVYWSELLRLQQLNNALTGRIHKEHFDSLKRDTMDMFSSEMGYLVPLIYKRVYPDTVKKVAPKTNK